MTSRRISPCSSFHQNWPEDRCCPRARPPGGSWKPYAGLPSAGALLCGWQLWKLRLLREGIGPCSPAAELAPELQALQHAASGLAPSDAESVLQWGAWLATMSEEEERTSALAATPAAWSQHLRAVLSAVPPSTGAAEVLQAWARQLVGVGRAERLGGCAGTERGHAAEFAE